MVARGVAWAVVLAGCWAGDASACARALWFSRHACNVAAAWVCSQAASSAVLLVHSLTFDRRSGLEDRSRPRAGRARLQAPLEVRAPIGLFLGPPSVGSALSSENFVGFVQPALRAHSAADLRLRRFAFILGNGIQRCDRIVRVCGFGCH